MVDYNPGWGWDDTWIWGSPDNPDADTFYVEANLGPIGRDTVISFDVGLDLVKIEDYTHVSLRDGGVVDVIDAPAPLRATELWFDDGDLAPPDRTRSNVCQAAALINISAWAWAGVL